MIFWIIAIGMLVVAFGYYSYMYLHAQTEKQKGIANLLLAPVGYAFGGLLGLFVFTAADDRWPWLMAIFTVCLVYVGLYHIVVDDVRD